MDALVYRSLVIGLPYMSPPERLHRVYFLIALAAQVRVVLGRWGCAGALARDTAMASQCGWHIGVWRGVRRLSGVGASRGAIGG